MKNYYQNRNEAEEIAQKAAEFDYYGAMEIICRILDHVSEKEKVTDTELAQRILDEVGLIDRGWQPDAE